MTPQQEKLIINNKWNIETDSKWNIGGKAISVFGFKFIKVFNQEDIGGFLNILSYVLDDKANVNPIKGRILFKITIRQLSERLGVSINTARSLLKRLILSGLISEKHLSTKKGVPSQYYIHCPATIVIDKLNIKEKTKPKKQVEEDSAW